MAGRQGFVTINNEPYVYQENSTGFSAALGLDTTGVYSISSSGAPGTSPSATSQIVIDPLGNTTVRSSAKVFIDAAAQISALTTAGPVLTDAAGNISSAAILAIGYGGTNTSTTPGNNAVMYFDGTKYVGLTNGITGQVLLATTGAAPSWGTSYGVTSLAGTANQITASAATGSVTLSTPATFIAPGTIASTTTLTAGNGFTVTTGTITLTPLNVQGIVLNSAAGVISTGATTNHAVLVGNASGQFSSLGVGTTGQVLIGSTGADPAFGSLGVNSNLTNHGVLLGQANAAIVATSAGTSGQPLLSGGAGGDPNWGTLTVSYGGTGATSFTAYSVVCAGTTATGTMQNVSGVGSAGQVLTSNGAGALPTWQASGSVGFTWNVTTVDAGMNVNNGYIANKAGLLTMTLPVTATVGSVLEITGINTATGWKIAQNGGQTIYFGTSATTTGVTGSIASTAIRDSVRLVCVVADTDFNVISSIGNITIA